MPGEVTPRPNNVCGFLLNYFPKRSAVSPGRQKAGLLKIAELLRTGEGDPHKHDPKEGDKANKFLFYIESILILPRNI